MLAILRFGAWCVVALILCLSASCGPFSIPTKHWPDAYWRDGDYYLIAVDTEAQMDLKFDSPRGFLLSLAGPTVFAVGANEHYVVAKQHPSSDGIHFDRSITNYYIVDRATLSDGHGLPRPKTKGPLERAEFEELARELPLPSFSTTFKNLESQDTGE